MNIKQYHSALAKLSHKKSPRSKKHYSDMGKRSAEIRRLKKNAELSTGK